MPKTQRFPTAIRKPTAIHRERVSIDKSALRGVREEGNGRRDVMGGCETALRNASFDIGVAIETGCLWSDIHRRFDPTWADRIATNAASAPLGRKGASEPD